MRWALVAAIAAGCSAAPLAPAQQVSAGDAERGRVAIADFGCVTCHHVPGVRGPQGSVGPPLDRFARRAYIAGQLPNGQDNLVRWITDPQGVERGTAMPDLDVPSDDATDMAAYLLSLD